MAWSRDPLARPEPLVRRVYAYVAYRLGDGPEAEDVTSETFARALKYRSSYDSSKGEPIAWLLGIARHCVDAALAPRPEVSGGFPETSDDGGFAGRTVEKLALAEVVAKLSHRDRELIALRYGADLTAAQIGTRLAISTNAAEVALHRALDRLRAHLQLPTEDTTTPVRVSSSEGISVREPRKRQSASSGESA